MHQFSVRPAKCAGLVVVLIVALYCTCEAAAGERPILPCARPCADTSAPNDFQANFKANVQFFGSHMTLWRNVIVQNM